MCHSDLIRQAPAISEHESYAKMDIWSVQRMAIDFKASANGS